LARHRATGLTGSPGKPPNQTPDTLSLWDRSPVAFALNSPQVIENVLAKFWIGQSEFVSSSLSENDWSYRRQSAHLTRRWLTLESDVASLLCQTFDIQCGASSWG
jgi:hypothetical protein